MNKLKYTLLIGTLSCLGMKAQNSLTVNITNIDTKKGQIEIGLFKGEKGFLKEGFQFLKKKVKVKGNSVQEMFTGLPEGNYAVAIFHDENMNGKCDTNFIGIPTEDYGFSNNFKPTVAAPKFSQTKISVSGNKKIDIKMIN